VAIERLPVEALVSVTDAKAVVLVVDDQIVNVRLITALLVQQGYSTISALGGEEGVALAMSERPDLVLLDVRMPDMDGFEVLRKLRSTPETADLPIIFLTADDDRENLIRGFTAGVNDYVTKPFVARELLARVRTNVDLKKSRDALRRFAQEKQDMAELVAHDLRNYLANIMFATDLQIAIPDVDLGVVRLAHSIRSSADAGLLFLQALLEQQEEQACGGVIEPLSVRLLLGEAVDLLNESARAKRIMLHLLPHDVIVVSGLRSSAVHVLQNLLSNAIKYSPPGSRVSISAASKGTRGRMMVMDQGPGISGPDQERLFQRFTRLSSEPTGGETSTGLGLALAKQQARAMGGDLWYEKRDGGGSIFTLELPLA
jgi:two-component system sensor histidine kinase/response regulator